VKERGRGVRYAGSKDLKVDSQTKKEKLLFSTYFLMIYQKNPAESSK